MAGLPGFLFFRFCDRKEFSGDYFVSQFFGGGPLRRALLDALPFDLLRGGGRDGGGGAGHRLFL